MKWIQCLMVVAVCMGLPGLASALEDADADELRAQFESIVQGLNDNSYDRFRRAIATRELTEKILRNRLIEPDVKKAFTSDASASIEQMFTSSFPPTKKEILGTLVDFQFRGGEGRAVVRYAASGYRYVYHVYELRFDQKGRMVIVDWIDYYQANRFSAEAGDALVMARPSKPATRNMLENKNLGDAEIFQVAELFKAVRDNKAERFFQIYDGMDESLHDEMTIMKLNLFLALTVRDAVRIENAAEMLVAKRPNDPLFSLRLIEYYIPTRQYDKAIDALLRLQDEIGIKDGATESLKATAALAMGNIADAEEYALQATINEPSLELSWWSLLRARTRAADYSAATEALARLEDDFGHNLGPQTLKKDPFLKVLADQQEYLDWRSSRD